MCISNTNNQTAFLKYPQSVRLHSESFFKSNNVHSTDRHWVPNMVFFGKSNTTMTLENANFTESEEELSLWPSG